MKPQSPFRAPVAMIVALVCALAGVGLFIGGLVIDREQTMISYLTAYMYALSLAIGALLWLVMTAAMGATWPTLVRRIAEAIAATFPCLAVLLLPIVFEMPVLYRWVHPSTISDEHARELVTKKLAYLNEPFFFARAGLYLVVLLVTAELARAWSLRQDADPRFDARRRTRAFSAAMFGPVLLVVSFLSFDWIMSTAPEWSSSMFGLYYAAGSLLGGTSLIVLLALLAERRGALALNESHHYALGRSLLTFLLVWGYTGFFQFMLIWNADKPDESSWYIDRGKPGWYWMTLVCILFCHLIVPFLALLPYRMKRSAAGLTFVAAWILACHFFDVYWTIHPSLRKDHFDFNGMDVAMLVGVCAACAAFGMWRLRGHATVAWRDPELPKALEYRSI